MTDYTMGCGCGWEAYAPTLKEAKAESRDHTKSYKGSVPKHEVYIDRNKDFGSGMEIDDSFKSVVIKS